LWQSANRKKIKENAGSKNCRIVGLEAIKLWKSTSSEEKAPFEEESERQKAAYEAFVATDAGKKALEEKKKVTKHRRQIKRQSKLRKEQNKYHKLVTKKMRECKVARKAIKKHDKLKKPTAYWLYAQENLKQIYELVGGFFPMSAKKQAICGRTNRRSRRRLMWHERRKGTPTMMHMLRHPRVLRCIPHVL
jgi:hypothetical protein